jgi:hypothetical protein
VAYIHRDARSALLRMRGWSYYLWHGKASQP